MYGGRHLSWGVRQDVTIEPILGHQRNVSISYWEEDKRKDIREGGGICDLFWAWVILEKGFG